MTINFADFPNMRDGNYRKTSDPLAEENCIAHACGARGEWWEPVLGRFWPVGPPYYNRKIESLIRVFQRRGFIACDSPEHEPEYEKIADLWFGRRIHACGTSTQRRRYVDKQARQGR